ncbi:Fungal Zn(2)-Cys(6) binuclear cluster domain [Rhizoctonia solani]|uniref:Fungal Zn(2)-Cys(6) binuclear cluster domain n=1 Tax=Rhizoctonia solani TaxID=456999 RepID=A0A8H8T2A0_9AGAM|nr:Fungal Zn(2)-Cys(6) binuclear cluster domain [Rhizoctonia solani]QRW25333.1 Fungal Zn(2)-Cys(6) binuclear cluster domain [Rhizoctonia solani]
MPSFVTIPSTQEVPSMEREPVDDHINSLDWRHSTVTFLAELFALVLGPLLAYTVLDRNMVVTHESAPPKAKPKGQEVVVTCQARRRGKKCDQGKLTEDDAQHPGCAACRRLRIECLGYARNRPEWLKGPQVDEFKRTIKMFLAENSPRVQRTPRTSDSGSLPFLTFDNLRNGAATSFVPVGPSSSSVNGAAEASSPAQPPEGQDGTRGDFNPPPIPPTYAHAHSLGIPSNLMEFPINYRLSPTLMTESASIASRDSTDPALAIDPALEDANMQTLAPVLAQLGRNTSAAPAPAAPVGENALHNIGPVEAAAVRAWAGVVGASVAWGEVVVEIVGATRAEPGTVISFTGPIPENLDQLGANALQACALMCLGLPGAEEVLAKRLEERRWGEEVAEGGIAENWQRAVKLEARQGKPAEVQDGLSGVKPEEAGGDVHMDSDDKSTVVAPAVAAATLNTPVVQNDPAVTSIATV